MDRETLLAGTVQVPSHVVFREFSNETVLLNLDSGQYYGLNTTAGRMFEVMQQAPTVGDALATLSEEYPDAGDALEADVHRLCDELSERGLVTVDA